MSKAFEMILEGTLVDEEGLLMLNASIETRNRITRIQFSWYQFQEFPSDLFGRAYTNLQHLDIRQNGKSAHTCIYAAVYECFIFCHIGVSHFSP